MKKEIQYAIGGIILGGALVWIGANIYPGVVSQNSRGMMNNSQQNFMSSQRIDQHFIEQMIPHHDDAITMAKLAREKAETSEVKQLAENIIISQSKENTQMKEWYREWFGKDVPTGSATMNQHGMMGGGRNMGMMGDEADMQRLANAENFDKAFATDMIPHHQMAVMMAQMLKNSTGRDEMKKLADEIISAQTKEIDQMRDWLKSW